MLFFGNIIKRGHYVVDTITVHDDADIRLARIVAPAPHEWTREQHFGMSFDEQQEVIFNTLKAFQEPD